LLASKKSKNKKIKHIFRMRIPIEEMQKYYFQGAYVAEDVINKHGIALIHKGTFMTSFEPNMEETLRNWGIKNIAILIHEQIEAVELEDIIKNSESNFVKINSKLAREIVERVGNVYSRIADGTCKREDIEDLVGRGRILAKEITETTEMMFCLGKVRGSDEYTYVHSLNVALIGGFLAHKLFPDDEEFIHCMSIGGILHDLGKAKVPHEILNKPGPLTTYEFEVMKQHAIYGEELVKKFGVHDSRILSVIRGHHERYGGNGYPDILSGDEISVEARISSVADVFDALTAKRVYKEPMECRSAITMMIEKMSPHFDPFILRTLVTLTGLYPPGTTVELSDGSLGMVIGTNGNDLLRPRIMMNFDKNGMKVEGEQIIDLNNVDKSLFIIKAVHELGKIAF